MIKVLIVDDEPIFRMGLQTCLDWNALGFQIVGHAADGEEALRLIGERRPDVVFTDIKMPVMDGLELTERIMAQYDDIFVIILSCYNDFDFVREALRLGAVDYMVKLYVNPEEFAEFLRRMKERIDQRKEKRHHEMLIRREFQISISQLKENFFKNLLLTSRVDKSELLQKIKVLDLRIGTDGNYAVELYIDRYFQAVNRLGDEQLLKFAFLNIVNEVINEAARGEAFEREKGSYAAAVRLPPGDPAAVCRRMVGRINEITESMYGFTVSAGMSRRSGRLRELAELLREAQEAGLGRFYAKNGYFAVYDPGKIWTPNAVHPGQLNAVHHALENTDLSGLIGLLDDLERE